ncbi:MAG TPA: electron transfer flavoprotein subunit alpha/FixB family protein [Dongiaceae bacterium]|nr:electron transfer flavoprotein subunit alpha/FixB family protein [Dongiaceae bacterium]
MNILVYVDSLDSRPTTIARELAQGARQLAGADGRVELAYFGGDVSSVLDLDADRVLTGPAAERAVYNPQLHAVLMAAAVETAQPDLILLGYTTSGLDLGPVIAIQRNLPLLSYCTAIRAVGGKLNVDNQVYGGKLVATTETELPAVLLVNAGTFSEGSSGQSRQAEVTELQLPSGSAANRITFASATQPDPNAVDITKADRLLCVGRGIGDEDAIVEAREVAGLMGGELVGSRPIIDIGWLPKERQVGKSGRKVKPQLYVALGVSGAPEHIEGMGTSGCIVAINTDAKAPIFDHAHIGAHVDVADFLPAFKDALSQRAR